MSSVPQPSSTNRNGTEQKTEMPMVERDEETGQYQETYPDEDFRAALNEEGSAGTQAVADVVGCSYDNSYKTLRRLKYEGSVSSFRVGNARLRSVSDEEIDK